MMILHFRPVPTGVPGRPRAVPAGQAGFGRALRKRDRETTRVGAWGAWERTEKLVSTGYQDLPGVTVSYRRWLANGYSVFLWTLAERCFGRKMNTREEGADAHAKGAKNAKMGWRGNGV